MQTALSGIGRAGNNGDWRSALDWAAVGKQAKEAADDAANSAAK